MEVSQRVPFLSKANKSSEKYLTDSKKLNRVEINIFEFCRNHQYLLSFLFIILGLLIGFTIYLITNFLLTNNLSISVALLEVKKCPACLGQSKCPNFYRSDVQFIHNWKSVNWSTLPLVGFKATIGLYETKKHVRLRRSASPASPDAVDEAVCRRGLRQGLSLVSEKIHSTLPCIPHLAIWRWLPTNDEDGKSIDLPLTRETVLASSFTSKVSSVDNKDKTANWSRKSFSTAYGPITRCASDRLFELLQNRFLERTSFGAETQWLRFDELMFLFNIAIDPQSLIIQAFPRSHHWPFPNYIGACGRWALEDNHGVPLLYFCSSPLWLRLRILLNILDLPEQLEHIPLSYSDHIQNSDKSSTHGYTIYLGNFDFESLFLIDPLSYNVTIGNLRHAIIVDTQTLGEFLGNSSEYNIPSSASSYLVNGLEKHQCLGQISEWGDTGGNIPPCLTDEHAKNLCSHMKSDHNYWAICASLIHNSKSACKYLFDQIPVEFMNLMQSCVHDNTYPRSSLFLKARQIIENMIDKNPIPFDWL